MGTAPGGRWRGSFTANVQGAKGGVVMDDQGDVQEGSAWGTVLDLIPHVGDEGSLEVPPPPTDQD